MVEYCERLVAEYGSRHAGAGTSEQAGRAAAWGGAVGGGAAEGWSAPGDGAGPATVSARHTGSLT